MSLLLSFLNHASYVSVVTSVSFNFSAWTSSILLYLFQVWYKQPSIRSLLWVLRCLHRAPIKGGFSERESRGCWGLTGVFWGETNSITKPGLNTAKRLLHCGCRSAQLHSFPLWDNAVVCEHAEGKTEDMFILRTAFCQKVALAKGLNRALFEIGKWETIKKS